MGELQQEPRREGVERKVLQAAGRGHHVALEVLPAPAERVQGHRFLLTMGHEPLALEFAALAEERHRLEDRYRRLRDRRVGGNDVAHPRLDPRQVSLRERLPPLHLAEVAPDRRRRVLDADLNTGEDLPGRRHEQEGQRAPVDAHAVAVGGRDRRHLRVLRQGRRQLAQPPVQHDGDDRRAIGGRRRPLHRQGARRQLALDTDDVPDESADRRLEDPAVRKGGQDTRSRQARADTRPSVRRHIGNHTAYCLLLSSVL